MKYCCNIRLSSKCYIALRYAYLWLINECNEHDPIMCDIQILHSWWKISVISMKWNYICQWWWLCLCLNTLRPRQNGRHFADDTFKRIFVNENVIILIEISQKFAPKGPINNIPPLVQVMAWRRPGDKPLFEPMLICLPTHICVTRPQWVNSGISSWYKL